MNLLLRSLSWKSVKANIGMLIRFAILEVLLVVGYFLEPIGYLWGAFLGVITIWYLIDVDSKLMNITEVTRDKKYARVATVVFVLLFVHVALFFIKVYNISPLSNEKLLLNITQVLMLIGVWYATMTVYLNYTFSSALKHLLGDSKINNVKDEDDYDEDDYDEDDYDEDDYDEEEGCDDCNSYSCSSNIYYNAYKAGFDDGVEEIFNILDEVVSEDIVDEERTINEIYKSGVEAGFDEGFNEGYSVSYNLRNKK